MDISKITLQDIGRVVGKCECNLQDCANYATYIMWSQNLVVAKNAELLLKVFTLFYADELATMTQVDKQNHFASLARRVSNNNVEVHMMMHKNRQVNALDLKELLFPYL